MIAIINSMTKKERRHPDLAQRLASRARRARFRTQPADVNRLLKQYQQMEKMMSKLGSGGIKGLMRQMKGAMRGMGGPEAAAALIPGQALIRLESGTRSGRAKSAKHLQGFIFPAIQLE